MGGQRIVSWVGVLAGAAVVVGLLCGLLWARLVHLPAYVVGPDYAANMSERGHAEVFASDAWFVLIGLVAGLLLGGVAWSWFKGLGWPVALVALGTGLLAGAICWASGQLWGPGSFETRLAHASPGDSVPVAFQLHAPAALVLWGLAALAPTLLASALGPEIKVTDGADGIRGRAAGGLPVAELEPATTTTAPS